MSTHGTGPLNEEIMGLYEAASNLVTIREARKDCIVKKMHCVVHDQEAMRYTSKKSVWTKVKKTGLYAYRTRKLSVLRCEGQMESYVGTMARLGSAGGIKENFNGGIE